MELKIKQYIDLKIHQLQCFDDLYFHIILNNFVLIEGLIKNNKNVKIIFLFENMYLNKKIQCM